MSEHPSIIFVHGAFSNADHCNAWKQLLEAAGLDCLVPSLPGHTPSDPLALAKITLGDYLASLESIRSALASAPIIIGHSMGGLLAQQLAATGSCSALVCLATAPPWMLPAQLRALPHLASLFPRILAGLPIRPSQTTFRFLALHDLPAKEQDELAETLAFESGRAYRSMILGTARVKASAVQCPVLCVSGGQDRIISRGLAKAVATYYGAEHQVHDSRGHWLLAREGLETIAKPVLEWLRQKNLLSTPAG